MTAPVRHCKTMIRSIDRELATLSPRADHERVRELTSHRMVYADILHAAGHPTPPPVISW